MNCDYCNEQPATTEYGACDDCAEYHAADDRIGPDLYRPDGSQIDRNSDEYKFYMGQLGD